MFCFLFTDKREQAKTWKIIKVTMTRRLHKLETSKGADITGEDMDVI